MQGRGAEFARTGHLLCVMMLLHWCGLLPHCRPLPLSLPACCSCPHSGDGCWTHETVPCITPPSSSSTPHRLLAIEDDKLHQVMQSPYELMRFASVAGANDDTRTLSDIDEQLLQFVQVGHKRACVGAVGNACRSTSCAGLQHFVSSMRSRGVRRTVMALTDAHEQTLWLWHAWVV